MSAVSLVLIAILGMPVEVPPPPVATSVAPAAAFPTVDKDQTRPTPVDLSRLKFPDGFNLRLAMTGDCFQYFTCLPINAPPDQQDCTYNGDPRNGCTIDSGVCNFCQICCENCFC